MAEGPLSPGSKRPVMRDTGRQERHQQLYTSADAVLQRGSASLDGSSSDNVDDREEEGMAGPVQKTPKKNSAPPPEYMCPLSLELFADPVSTVDGHVYERVRIEAWLSQNATSPNTGEELVSKLLIPQYSLRSLVSRWRHENACPEAAAGKGSAAPRSAFRAVSGVTSGGVV